MSRKLDALVAEWVEKYECVCDEEAADCPIHAYDDHDTLLPYSSDIAAAWRVAEKMREVHGCGVNVNIVRAAFVLASDRGSYSCEIMGGRLRYSSPFLGLSATAITAPLAICLAALRAIGVPEAEIQEALDVSS